MHTNIQEVKIQRVNIVTTTPFDTVVARIEAAIGHRTWMHFGRAFRLHGI